MANTSEMEPKQPVSQEATEEVTGEPKTLTEQDIERIFTEKYKGIQRTLNQKDSELKNLKKELDTLRKTPSSTGDMIALLELQARESADPGMLAAIASLRQKEATRQAAEYQASQYAEQKRLTTEKRNAMEDQIKEAGEDPDDPKFDRVWSELSVASKSDGDWGEAESTLAKRLSSKSKATSTKKDAKKPETEAEIEERVRRKLMEEKGLLNKEKILPVDTSGATVTLTRQQLASMTPAEYGKITASGKKIVLKT